MSLKSTDTLVHHVLKKKKGAQKHRFAYTIKDNRRNGK